ncbi:NAD-dependent protein deacetylase [soil metagenome]
MNEETALADIVQRGGVMVLSGAGLSTDSGIPDYRGAGRLRRATITYQQFVGEPASRRRYWARSHLGWARIARAEPNRGHEAVASLGKAGLVTGVVTQNVDRLHQRAGSLSVVDLHGSLEGTICLHCADSRTRLELHHRLDAANPRFAGTPVIAPDGDAHLAEEETETFRVVDCLRCGGVLKPDVVMFGETVPVHRVRQAYEMLEAAALVLVLGSSLSVMSGYRFVRAAVDRRLPVAIVNRGPTRADAVATVRVDAGLSDVLPRLVPQPSKTKTECSPA